MPTVYVLGAGASFHAGYPLCSQLWSEMVSWVNEGQEENSEFRNALDLVARLNGPVGDVEAMFTDLDLHEGGFKALAKFEGDRLRVTVRACLRAYFKSVRSTPSLYAVFADRLLTGDAVITFNYDVSLENALAARQRFRVVDGYGFEANWDEPESPVMILKLHGSMNWIGSIF